MLRPNAIYIDLSTCVACGVCEDLLPDALTTRHLEVTTAALDAMAACPTGSIRWLEASVEKLDVVTNTSLERAR